MEFTKMCFLIITFGVINDVVDGSEACNYKQLPRYLGTSDRIFQCTICNGQLQWLKNKLPIAHHMASSRIGVKSRTSPHAFSILTRKSNDSGVCLTAILVQTATGHQPVIGTLVCRGGMTRHYCRRSSDLYHPSQTHRDHIHLKRITVHGLNFTAHMFMCEVLGRNSLSWLINDEIYCRYSSNPVNKQCISVMSNKLLKGSFELQSGHLSSFTGMLYISDEVYYHGLFNVTCKSGNVSNLMIITSVVMQTQGTTEIDTTHIIQSEMKNNSDYFDSTTGELTSSHTSTNGIAAKVASKHLTIILLLVIVAYCSHNYNNNCN